MSKLLELAIQAGLRKEHGSDREYMSDFDWRDFAKLVSANTCKRCGKVHDDEPFDQQVAINKAADEIARQIDREALLQAGMIHEGGGYELSTHEKQQAWERQRNYTYGEANDNTKKDI